MANAYPMNWRMYGGRMRMRLKYWIVSARPPVFSARKSDFDKQNLVGQSPISAWVNAL